MNNPSTLGINISLEEYFKYHPPQTEERKQKHKIANNAAFELVVNLFDLIDKKQELIESQTNNLIGKLINNHNAMIKIAFGYKKKIEPLFNDSLCKKYFEFVFEEILDAINYEYNNKIKAAETKEKFLMFAQQARMFSNQGITIDSLVPKEN